MGNPTIRLFDRSRLRIGKFSSVAEGTTFILGGIHRTDTVTTSLLERPHGADHTRQGDIVVGSDVWIAGNATILSGTTIGDGAVVGAGSVVIDDVPLRAKLEQSFDILIDDETWTSIVTPADVVRIVSTIETRGAGGAPAAPACAQRVYDLNMPQMALGGLSESWLFKEIGDIHWSIITNGLQMPSSELKDGSGCRLYATFTRFQLSSTASVAAYGENERIAIDAQTSRYGAGLFFTEATVQGDGKSSRARVMSSFSKFGEAGANTSLLKGQPEIPPGCTIQALADLPEPSEPAKMLPNRHSNASTRSCPATTSMGSGFSISQPIR